MTSKEKHEIQEQLDNLVGSRGAMVFNEKLERIRKIPLAKLYSLTLEEAPYIIAIDGTATPKMIEGCENLGCSNLIATNFVDTDTKVNLVSL